MNKRTNTVWGKKLPSFIGIAVLAICLLSIGWLSTNTLLSGTKAASGSTPKMVQVSNISDTSFTVSFVTDDQVVSTLNYGTTSNLGTVILDDRDQSTKSPVAHRIHYFTLHNMLPKTTYFFALNASDQSYRNNGAFYQTTTAPVLSSQTKTQVQISGKVALTDSSIPTEAMVTVASDTSQQLSALVQPDGSYTVSLDSLRREDLSAPADLSSSTILHVVVNDPTAQSTISLLAGQTNPLPQITLSKNYDFTGGTSSLVSVQTATSSASGSPSASTTPSTSGFPTIMPSISLTPPNITVPQKDEKMKDQKPMFKGIALPNETVQITIQSSQTISASVQADTNGNWQYRPMTPLSPGAHTITIVSKDASGILQTISESFTVFAAGSQFTEPSVSPTNSPTPTASPTATPVFQPTPIVSSTTTPTPTVLPTPTINITPTPAVLAPTATPFPTATPPPLPKSGNSSVIIGIGTSILTIGIGAVLFFLTAL